jgi:mannitol/fructose-specific phosphotransferase system IIA component (Ntr-type)
MRALHQAVSEGCCLLNLDAHTMPEIVDAGVRFLVESGRLPANLENIVADGVKEHERLVPTAIGHACAVPHFYDDCIDQPQLLFIRLRHPANLGAPDGIGTRYVFLLLGATDQTVQHLDTLSGIARLMSDNVFHFEAIYASNQQGVADAIERHVERMSLAVPPKPREVSAGLQSGKWPFAGLTADLQRRLPHYADDIRSGLHPKCIASIVFMFFACLAPAVTFGGFMGRETGGLIGAPEMLIATAVCGLVYSLIAGQPLTIVGGIGPLLIFTIILYQLCDDYELGDQFLGVYGWVGIWTSLFTLLLSVTNASNLMKYFTRFTDEIFSALMSLIFIYKAVEALAETFSVSNADPGGSMEKALLALVLAIGTFYIAVSLAGFRRSHFLFPWMREALADFGPSIALGCMVGFAWWIGSEETLDTLQVYAGTNSARTGIFVDLGSVPAWAKFGAAIPAALATVLIFLSQNITARLVNSPQNKLEKGESYHLDLAVIGLMIGICSLFGWPWMVAAAVRSLAHVRALADVEEVATANGASQEKIIHVRENRVTGVVIHILIGLTLLVLPLLEYVPMAALYGIFLFMGFMSLRGIQFIERLTLWIMDSAMYPMNHYTRRVPIRTIHLFTLVQLLCLVVLCFLNVSESKVLRIIFPVFIALLVPVRALMGRFFDADHIGFLDADEEPDEEDSHWV